MLRPNFIGPKALYLNPDQDELTTTNMAAIDAGYSNASSSFKPYAYSATVREDYDTRRFVSADSGSVLVSGKRVSFGLFMTPDNDKGNLLWQLSGKLSLVNTTELGLITSQFFFGRKATDNTVVSSKASANNTLSQHILLPYNMDFSLPGMELRYESELFSLELEAGYVYCFGASIWNLGADATLFFDASLAMRKYGTEIDLHRPSR